MKKIFWMVLLVIFSLSCKENKSTEGEEMEDMPEERSLEQEKSRDTLNNLLKVENPRPEQLIESPLEIKGEARGYWFFEAIATAELLDENLQSVSQTSTKAVEWMTEDWVPFSGTMTFKEPSTETGYLVLHKANASGLEEHDMSDTIPIRFRR